MTFESKVSARSKIVINYQNILVQPVKHLQYKGSDMPYTLNEDSRFIFCGLTAQLDLRLLHCWGFNISVFLSHTHAHTHSHTHTHIYTQCAVGLLWTSDQLVAETATYTKNNKRTTRTSIPSVIFETAILAIKWPKDLQNKWSIFKRMRGILERIHTKRTSTKEGSTHRQTQIGYSIH